MQGRDGCLGIRIAIREDRQHVRAVHSVALRAVTADNWKACSALAVDLTQQPFVPPNLYSIAEAQFYPQARSCAIYAPPDTLVGYLLYGIDAASGCWKVFRLMIDRHYQGQGYGRAAMQQVLADIATQPNGAQVLVSYHRDNTPAQQLYRSLGFTEVGWTDEHVTARFDAQRTDR